MTIKQIFKYEIYETKLNFDLDSIKRFCFQIYETETGLDKLEMFSGWQSKNIYNEYPIINMLRTEISKHLEKYLKYLKFNANIELDNFWINFHEYKDYTEPHIHPFSIISGVDFMTCLLTLSIIIISSLVTKPLAASIPSATRTENQILLSFSIRVLRVALIN